MTKDGHLFHIDFGHFLGNFKKKFGVNRERAAFVFTPEMAYVMGGRRYQKSALFQKFLHLCSRAFRTLRENAETLENMFTLMVAAGMPELMHETDILYMRNKLNLDMSWQEADNILLAEIQKSLATTYRRYVGFAANRCPVAELGRRCLCCDRFVLKNFLMPSLGCVGAFLFCVVYLPARIISHLVISRYLAP